MNGEKRKKMTRKSKVIFYDKCEILFLLAMQWIHVDSQNLFTNLWLVQLNIIGMDIGWVRNEINK